MRKEKISCYIIDDEPIFIQVLKKYIDRTGVFEIKGTATDPEDALNYLQDKDPSKSVDVVFLDINMEPMTGIELMSMIDNRVVLITAHKEHALESYAFENPIDYMVKPIDYNRFLLAVKKIEKVFPDDDPSANIDLGNRTFRLSEITHIKSDGDLSEVYYGKDRTIIPGRLGDIHDRLPKDTFIRIHKSFVVNKNKIVNQTFKFCELAGGITVPKGRSFN